MSARFEPLGDDRVRAGAFQLDRLGDGGRVADRDRVDIGQRWDAPRTVVENVDEDATGGKHQHRPERGLVHHADSKFETGHEWVHEYRRIVSGRPGHGGDCFHRFAE